ncbi:MAG TPA: caspase family protein [Thermoanaerobaculia bacterium]|jgi:WD40 repeat protein/sulfur relay (sulfurtransferase) complex TusBCD TusD component (DsrE family)|nr:caspase family protein [Thermoanaerobaculia bacterium]
MKLATALLSTLLISNIAAAQTPKVAPKIVVQTGHAEFVRSVAFSPDGTLFASGSNDNSIKLWDVASRRELRTLAGHTDHVLDVRFSSDGLLLASLGYDKTLRIWDVASGEPLVTINATNGAFAAFCLTPDSKTVITANHTFDSGGGDNLIRFWNVASGKEERTLDAGEGITALAISHDSHMLAMGSNSGPIKLWDLAANKERATLSGHTDEVTSIDISPDGSMAASGSKDGTARLWDLVGAKALRSIKHRDIVDAVAFSPDGKSLATGGWDHTVHFWDVSRGTEIRFVKGHTDIVWGIAFTPDGETLASSSADKSIKLWDVASGNELGTFAGHVNFVEGLALSNKGRTLISHDALDSVRVWDLASGKDMRRIAPRGTEHVFERMSGSDAALIGGAQGGLITLYDANGTAVKELRDFSMDLEVLTVSPDQKLLAGADGAAIKIWNLATAALVTTLGAHPRSLAFSNDARFLACGTINTEVKVFEIASGREVFSKVDPDETGWIRAVAFSPDGATIAAVGGTGKVRILDAATGAPLRAFGANTSPAIVFSADGKQIWSGGEDGTITQWNVSDGAQIRTLDGHSGTITSLVLRGSKNRTLISSSRDSSVKIWDAQTGAPLATLVAFDQSDWLVITPDGLFDGTAAAYAQILWRFSPRLRDVAPVEAFFGDFFYPNLLSDLMSGKRPKASQSIAEKDRRSPVVHLQLAGPATGRDADVAVRISDSPAGAQDVRLFRNGSLVKVWHGDVLAGKGDAFLKTTLPVVAGENRLTAYAFNRDNVKSADSTLLVQGAPSLQRKGTTYVLAVGVNSYANKDFDLKYAVADAGSFGAEWKTQQDKLGSFAKTEVTTLADDQATKPNILKALGELAAKVAPEDAVVIYFAGHGTAQSSRFYLIPHDLGYAGGRDAIDDAGLKTILDHSVSDIELQAAIEKIDAGQILMVIDACNSGQALESEEKRRGPMNSKGLAQLAYEKGMYILTAAQSYQAAQEASKFGHGFLTYALIEEGIVQSKADDEPKDGSVMVREWFDFATQRVPQMQLELMKEAQAGRGVTVAFVKGDEQIADPAERNVQRPRVFYRRELEAQPLVVAKPK